MATTRRTRSSAKLHAEYVAEPAPVVAQQAAKVQVDEDSLHHEYEFGGPVGVTAMMVCFPALFYYLYVSLFFYDGQSARSPLRATVSLILLFFLTGQFATPDNPLALFGPGGWAEFLVTIAILIRDVRPIFIDCRAVP